MRSIQFIMVLMIATLTMSFSFFKSKPRDYEDIANEISAKVAKKLTKKHKMEWVGEGGGMMGSVYMIGLHFHIYHPMDRNEARERLVDCVEEILAAINSNQEIRPFLKNYPFTTENLQISIHISGPDRRELYDPSISVVSIFESTEIIFKTKEPYKQLYKNEYIEPYQEALAMVKGNR